MNWSTHVYDYVGHSLNLYQCPAYGNRLDDPSWHNYRADLVGRSRLPQRVQSSVDPNIYGLVFSKYKMNLYIGYQSTFGMGVGLGSKTQWPIGRPVLRIATDPADTVMLVDTWDAWFAYFTTPACSTVVGGYLGGDRSEPDNYSKPYFMAHIGKWHNNRTNVLFIDGHVQLEQPESEYLWYDTDDSHWQIVH